MKATRRKKSKPAQSVVVRTIYGRLTLSEVGKDYAVFDYQGHDSTELLRCTLHLGNTVTIKQSWATTLDYPSWLEKDNLDKPHCYVVPGD